MKKFLTVSLFLLITLSACSSEKSTGTFMYWTDKTDNQIQRLDKANIKYEIRQGEIWIRKEDLFYVVACCS